MGSVKRPAAERAAAERAAANLRRIRQAQGLTIAEFSRRLAAIGHPIVDTGILKTEQGKRALSVDDLMAFSVILGVSPKRLLLPAWAIGDLIPVVGDVKARDTDAWAWVTGEKPLTVPGGGSQLSGSELAVFQIQNQPHHYQG
jgi:transcriptional regulator with XRE-family HTH domain